MLAKTNQGFTLPELMISITVLAIVSASFLVVFNNFLFSSTRTNKQLEMVNESQNLIRSMTNEIRYGAGIRQTNSITDANAPAGGWNTSVADFVIITTIPALDNDNDYIINTDTGTPYLNELVYYRTGNELYKRTLANPDATGNASLTTCPEASASPTCPADRKLLVRLDTATFTLYDQDDALTTVPSEARSIEISIDVSEQSFGDAITFENNIRMTLRNQF